MQKNKKINLTSKGKDELNIKSNESQEEEETLLILADIICNIIIKEINRYENGENNDEDST